MNSETPKEAFINRVTENTTPKGANLIWADKVELRFIEEGYKITPKASDALVLQHIQALRTGEGYGSACMDVIKDFADSSELKLYALPATTQADQKDGLLRWYARHGFKPLKGEGLDPEAVCRLPNAE